MALSHQLVTLLRCPQCGGELTPQGEYLVCPTDRVQYPINDDIPQLLIEEVIPLDAQNDE